MSDYPAAIVAAVLARPDPPAATVAEEVNSLTLSVTRAIPNTALRKLWTETGVLARAWVVSRNPQYSYAEQWRCKAVYDAVEGGTFADFNPEDAGQLERMTAYFTVLKAAGPDGGKVLTPEIEAKTLALATVEMTGAQLMGRPLDESDVMNIRKKGLDDGG